MSDKWSWLPEHVQGNTVDNEVIDHIRGFLEFWDETQLLTLGVIHLQRLDTMWLQALIWGADEGPLREGLTQLLGAIQDIGPIRLVRE